MRATLSDSQRQLPGSGVRDFVKWVPRQLILDLDAEKVTYPKGICRRLPGDNCWGCASRLSGVGGDWTGS